MQVNHYNLLSMDELHKTIKAVATQRVSFDTGVQIAAVQCIGQSIQHRNVEPAKQLLEAVGSHVKRTLVAYFEKFGNIALEGKGKNRKLVFFEVGVVTPGEKLKWTPEYAEAVANFHWTKASPEQKPVSQYDALEILDAAFKRVDKLVQDAGVTVTNLDAYRKVKAAKAAAVAALLSKEIDAVTHTAPLSKHELAVRRAADERTPATGEQLNSLKQHFNGAEKAA